MRNNEPFVQPPRLEEELASLWRATETIDNVEIRRVLCDLVEGYTPRDETFAEQSTVSEWPLVSRSIH
jgi:hypothetical protein